MGILGEAALGDDGDFALTNGDFSILSGAAAVAQRVSVRLRCLLGEWRTDTSRGVPWLQTVLGQRGVSQPLIASIVRAKIEDTEDVEAVLELDVSLDRTTRRCSISGRVRATDGSDDEFLVTVEAL